MIRFALFVAVCLTGCPAFAQIAPRMRCALDALGNRVCRPEVSIVEQTTITSVFAVGARDKDGAVITSVGSVQPVQSPTVAPTLPQAAPPAMESRRERKTSRAAIIEAVDKAESAGSIDADKARAIRRATYRPRMLAQIESLIAERAQAEGYAVPMGSNGEIAMEAINWEALGDFIVKIAPIIFKLIELFL